uniref:CARD domain-containing protein n=1 Tax=Plectus sambesii TaxID=2011161 RepID=A0A914VVF9_9BILA
MKVSSVVDYLIGTEPPILLSSHENEIMKITDSEERNRKFLTVLQQRGEINTFEQFLEALKFTQQYELYNNILDRSKKSINAKYSDKNQEDKGAEFGGTTNASQSDAAKIDENLQKTYINDRLVISQPPSNYSTSPSSSNAHGWDKILEK